MAYNFWLLVMFVWVFLLPVHGHEACYEDSWTYHSHTHSCFRLFRLPKTWTEARDYCSEIQLGNSYGVITRLPKIDDETTDDFIRNYLFPTRGWNSWIGLHYNNEKNAFRWDGYPDETPKYTATNWERPTLPYVATNIDGWRGADSVQTHHLVCQHSAKKIGIIMCEQEVQADVWKFTCTSDKSPVRAGCQWTYKYDGDPYYRAWRSVDSTSHESHTEIQGGNISYITKCTVTFPNVNAGIFMFRMKMYPDISGLDISTNEKALTTGWLNIIIYVPDVPIFKKFLKTLQSSSPIHFHENYIIHIMCHVKSGNPPVHSVTLSCEFPFKDSDEDNKHTVSGRAYVMDEMASRHMNGKKCTCIGNHLTGPIESSPLTFNVTYPTEIKDFTANGDKFGVELDVNDPLTLSCVADGNPVSDIKVWKLGTSYVDTSNWQSDESESRVEKHLEAQCNHNGRYRCSAYNVISSQEEIQDLDIRVRCPPTYCNETSRDLKLTVKPGTPETVSICVVAYPMPVLRLLKNSKTGWKTLEGTGDQISHLTSFYSQQNVTISFPVLSLSHLGEYALDFSVGSGATSSRLYFQLTAPLAPCNVVDSEVHEVTIGQPIIFRMCVTAFPSPSKLVMQIAKDSFWQDYSNHNVIITMGVDFNTLTIVTIVFLDVKAMDIGQYRLFDSQEVNGAASSYLMFSLSGAQPKDLACSSSLSTGTIVGLILAFNVVVIILTVLSMIAFRKLLERNKHKTQQASESGRVNAGFHKPEEEATNPEYVEVPEHFKSPGKDIRAPSQDVPEVGVYEGEEPQSIDPTMYEKIRPAAEDEEDKRKKKECYDIVHADDPNYNNLNRDQSRKYETIGDKGPSGVYESAS